MNKTKIKMEKILKGKMNHDVPNELMIKKE